MSFDDRNKWIPTFHVDLRKTSLLNRLMSDFAEKRYHYERLCEAIRGTTVHIAKSLDHCIVEETWYGLVGWFRKTSRLVNLSLDVGRHSNFPNCLKISYEECL